jgi:hypothetical protein
LELPPLATRLLIPILGEMARGNAVAVVPLRAELSTQQASHRRVDLAGLITYKRHVDAGRRRALEQLVSYDQELGI